MKRIHFLAITMGCLLVTLTIGCGASKPSRFYVLSPVADGDIDENRFEGLDAISIGVGPIGFPEMLDRPQIVTRLGSNEVQLSEYDRWAGSFQDDFAGILAENLSMMCSSEEVHIYPWQRSTEIDYQITLDIRRFDGEIPGDVVLDVSWTILQNAEQGLYQQRSRFSKPVDGGSYSAYVSAQSGAIADLSRQIALAITSMDSTADD